MNLKRIDAFEINFVESAARKEFKFIDSTGSGEARIYIGTDEKKYDEFFDFENVEYCITPKEDLVKYMNDAYDEYMNPSQNYIENITNMYNMLKTKIQKLDIDTLKYKFRKKFDEQNRYYIVLEDGKNWRKNYNYIRDIALPRITKYCFVKFQDEDTNKKYIYMKPILFVKSQSDELLNKNITANVAEEYNKKITIRKKQNKYRLELLSEMPFCPFTNITEDRILVACHIKPFSVCENDEERYDCKNGITMTPTFHTLFDIGFITFEDDGKLIISPFLSNVNKKRLNIIEGQKIRLQVGSAKYLKYHRENIFNNITKFNIE